MPESTADLVWVVRHNGKPLKVAVSRVAMNMRKTGEVDDAAWDALHNLPIPFDVFDTLRRRVADDHFDGRVVTRYEHQNYTLTRERLAPETTP